MFLVMEYLTTGKLRRGVGEQKEVKLRLLFLIMFELLKIKVFQQLKTRTIPYTTLVPGLTLATPSKSLDFEAE